jgi:type II secretory ATPase GspE/PulE/Tfp pilus assembly ATPase PilB-like protein
MFQEKNLASDITRAVYLNKTDKQITFDLLEKEHLTPEKMAILLKEHYKEKGDVLFLASELGILKPHVIVNFIEETYKIRNKSLVNAFLPISLRFKINPHLLLKYKIFPFFENEKSVFVASRNIFDLESAEIARILETTKEINVFFASEAAIRAAISFAFKEEGKFKRAIENVHSIGTVKQGDIKSENTISKDPIIEFTESLLEEAVFMDASHIHLENEKAFVKVRFRVDGTLLEMAMLQKENWGRILNRLKILTGINISENKKSQEGRMEGLIMETVFTLHSHTSPTPYGENMVIKLHKSSEEITRFEKLGFTKINMQKIIKSVENESGIILISGESESGKSITLYSLIDYISDSSERKIALLETRVENAMPSIFQPLEYTGNNLELMIQVINKQDANFIALDEIKDKKTLDTLFESAQSGKKILACLKAKDAFNTLEKIMALEISAYLISGYISSIISQKLIKKLCEFCKMETQLNAEILKQLRLAKTDVKHIYKSCGCPACFNTGYKGRAAIIEVLQIENELEEAILEKSSKKDMIEIAKKKGFSSFFEDARLKVLQGITDLAEMKRVFGL